MPLFLAISKFMLRKLIKHTSLLLDRFNAVVRLIQIQKIRRTVMRIDRAHRRSSNGRVADVIRKPSDQYSPGVFSAWTLPKTYEIMNSPILPPDHFHSSGSNVRYQRHKYSYMGCNGTLCARDSKTIAEAGHETSTGSGLRLRQSF